MKFINTTLLQTKRNLQKTWPTQFMTLLTVSLSVLIFSFFFLIYMNMIKAGEKLNDDLRLTIYLEEEPVLEMQMELVRKITNFSPVDEIRFVSREEAFKRLADQLRDNVDVLDDLDPSLNRSLPQKESQYSGPDTTILRISCHAARRHQGTIRTGMGRTLQLFYEIVTDHCFVERFSSHHDRHLYGGVYHSPCCSCQAGRT